MNANGSTASYENGSMIAIEKSDKALFEYAEEEKVSFERSPSKNIKSSSDVFITNVDADQAPKRDRMKSSRIITDSMRKKDNEMKKSHGKLGRMETIIEEKSQRGLDDEDILEKQILGNLLVSKFELEIDDRVSAHLSNTNLSNNRSAFNDVRDPESRNDLTQSLLSDQSGTFNDPNKDPYKPNENGDYNVPAD